VARSALSTGLTTRAHFLAVMQQHHGGPQFYLERTPQRLSLAILDLPMHKIVGVHKRLECRLRAWQWPHQGAPNSSSCQPA
jgi:hypothetical protein